MHSRIVIGLAGLTVVLLGHISFAHAQENAWGNVKGQIIWGPKEIPECKQIEAVKGHQDKMACMANGHVVIDEIWVVNPKNKGLKWTFVWLAAKNGKMPIHPNLQKPRIDKLVMDQPGCAFTPHALALREGQILVAKNSSMISHNFKWTGLSNSGNVLIPAGKEYEIKGLVVDRLPVSIECSIHTWMKGNVGIFDHPYYAVTNADGNFEFKDAPAGEYRLRIWHGSGGWLGGAKGSNGQAITIKAGETLELGSLKYTPPK
jgi:hypothetical protein